MFLYRYNRTVRADEFGPIFVDVKLILKEYLVTRETPSGYWIIDEYDKRRWVAKGARKSFAYDTKEAAALNLLKRSAKEVKYLNYKLEVARRTNYLAENLKHE